MTVDAAIQPLSRPADRKQLILEAAGRLFTDRGYDRVSMADVGAAVGITGGALYRHYANRYDLLTHVIWEGLLRFNAAATTRDLAATDPAVELEILVADLAALAWDRRPNPLLWQRESRHLPSDERHRLRMTFDAMGDSATTLLRQVRPTLQQPEAALLVWSAYSIMSSPAFHDTTPRRPRFESLLGTMSRAVAAMDLPNAFQSEAVRSSLPLPEAVFWRTSRRETLLRVAMPLFARHGYTGTSMEDIGSAAGIAGASVYEHFSSKAELLATALHRRTAAMELSAAASLGANSDPRAALMAILADHVATVSVASGDTTVLLGDTVHLPEADQSAIRRRLENYVSECVNLYRETRPDLAAVEARFVIQSIFGLLNDVPRIRFVRDRPHLRDELIAIAHCVLEAAR